ncbi:hypothetical protein ACQ3G6_17415 [Allorhizobium undicola]|uniref:hypothetical protein n=1 Tax=Allorhizobium undicola TaxID=78527 RepID=UPI000A3DB4FB|nr:hypothetical protein [Allorhizobium undicola]
MPKDLDHTITRIPVSAEAMARADAAMNRSEGASLLMGLGLGLALWALILTVA